MTTLAQYERARAALAEATRIDQVLSIHDEVEHVKLYARQIKDQALLADAAEFQMRVERRLGAVIVAAKQAGHFAEGRRKKNGSSEEPFPARLEDVGVDKKLSARAQRFAALPDDDFENAAASRREHIIAGRAKIIEDGPSVEQKKAQRAERERVLGDDQRALPDKRYGVIYADPEWRFEPYSRDTGMDRAADNHYPTSGTDAICQRDVASIAADDCALFLWATVPMLPDALKVMAAWGFAYKSHCVWTKDKVGTGFWFRNAHELLLVGTRGNIPAPAMGTQWPSTIEGRVTKHSTKPERFYELIEEYFPNLPKIELNARAARKGWDAWGNEAPTDAAGRVVAHDYDGEVIDPSVPCEAIIDPKKQWSGPTLADCQQDDNLDIPTFLRRPLPETA